MDKGDMLRFELQGLKDGMADIQLMVRNITEDKLLSDDGESEISIREKVKDNKEILDRLART